MKKRIYVFLICLLASTHLAAAETATSHMAQCKAHAVLTSRVLQLSQSGVPMMYVFQALNLSMADHKAGSFALEIMSLYNMPIQKDPAAKKQLIALAAKNALNECLAKRS